MKNLLLITIFFISALSFTQNTGSIYGKLVDAGSVNEPLILAEVVVKETGTKALSDEKGVFKFEHLTEGTYTLLCSFVGYETKAIETKIVSGKISTVNLSLEASTISLDDLALTLASANSETASKTVVSQ